MLFAFGQSLAILFVPPAWKKDEGKKKKKGQNEIERYAKIRRSRCYIYLSQNYKVFLGQS